jgi:hypothetical protein
LIPSLGLPERYRRPASSNLAIAALVLWWSKVEATRGTAKPQTTEATTDETRWSSRAHCLRDETPMIRECVHLTPLILAASFLTGASSFIYEIGWIRMLSLVLGSATHSFELMLSSFILGLALGGLWIRKRVDTAANPGVLLGYIQIVMGCAALATVSSCTTPLSTLSRCCANGPEEPMADMRCSTSCDSGSAR